MALGLGCGEDPEEPNAFQTQGDDDEVGTETSELPDQLEGAESESTTTTDSGEDTTTTESTSEESTTTTDGGAACGNGVIDDGEQCDGGNLGGFSCSDLGYSGGTLACDPVTCTYDASGCTTDTTTSGGTSG
ncbi:hypothetical protein ACNOYE_09300 [Nannocystaceae bacterium ST9]